MHPDQPRVSVGIPVYNGEKFVATAIESVLDQTYTDFEVIISDNASEDGTGDICRSFAERDGRIAYQRNEHNLGASPNYRRVFEPARGEYFCWLPADEAMLPPFLERCVAVLDAEPDVVLAFGRYLMIHDTDPPRPHEASMHCDLRQATAHERVAKLFGERIIGPNWPIFGLFRTSALRTTGLIRPMIGADDMLTLEMALRGKLAQVPEHLYVLRTHAAAWHRSRQRGTKGRWLGVETAWAAHWFDTRKRQKVVFPHWRRTYEFARLMARSEEPPVERLRLLGLLPGYVARHWRRMAKELVLGVLQLVTLPLVRRHPPAREAE